MKKEDKELLLRDLCARLPYGVICYNSDTESNFKLCDIADIDSGYPTFDYGYGELEAVKPYLRPISSMTEEERNWYKTLLNGNIGESIIKSIDNTINWLNAHHFDYHGLIPMGLALPSPDGMYNNQ